ncbi:hypothetical protein JCM13991_05910 [Thermodesulfovibrio hydrogeniphilus]
MTDKKYAVWLAMTPFSSLPLIVIASEAISSFYLPNNREITSTCFASLVMTEREVTASPPIASDSVTIWGEAVSEIDSMLCQ